MIEHGGNTNDCGCPIGNCDCPVEYVGPITADIPDDLKPDVERLLREVREERTSWKISVRGDGWAIVVLRYARRKGTLVKIFRTDGGFQIEFNNRDEQTYWSRMS